MNRTVASILLLVGFVTLLSLPLSAQVPTRMPIEGHLTDLEGMPVDGQREVVFRIYEVMTGGSELWTETVAVSFVSGSFIAYLGIEEPIDASVFTGGGSRYLGVEIDGEELLPRYELASVPFAQVAEVAGVAETLEGLGADAFVRANDQQWADLQGVPDNLLDLAALNCGAGEFAAYDATNWVCQTVTDTLAQQSCSPGETVVWDGTAWQCAPVDGMFAAVATSGSYNDLVDRPTLYTDTDAQLVVDTSIATHSGDPAAHHARYTDGEADARIALHAATSDAHHVRYSDGEVDARVGIHAADSAAHHVRYSDSEADARVALHTADASAHHTRYADSEADARVALHAAQGDAHHSRYTDAEVLSAVTTSPLNLASGSTLDGAPLSSGPHTVDTDTLASLGCSDGDTVRYSATTGWECETPESPSTFGCSQATSPTDYSTTSQVCSSTITLGAESMVSVSLSGLALNSSGGAQCIVEVLFPGETQFVAGGAAGLPSNPFFWVETTGWSQVSLTRYSVLPAGTHTIEYGISPRTPGDCRLYEGRLNGGIQP